ncbi:MAG: GNAT family N-acetyltransferase [Smithella sp.]
MIAVHNYSISEAPVYDQCIVSNPENLIYSTRPFLTFLQEVTGEEAHCLVAEEDNHILGVFPYLLKRNERYGTVYNSLPWYGSYGACTLADNTGSQVRNCLIDVWCAMLYDCPDLLTATAVLSPFEETYRYSYSDKLVNGTTDSRIGQITNLPDDGADLNERLLAVFSQKTRNLVRKSLKQGFSLVVSDDEWAWRFLHETHLENMQAIGGKAKPWEHFAAMRSHIPMEWRSIYVAMLGNMPVAGMLLFTFNKTVEYITPVVKVDYRSTQPLSFLIYNGMIDAIKKGFASWNWGGTWITQESLHHFKAGWGAKDHPYTYLIHASPGSVEIIKKNQNDVINSFPYYYVFPFNQLT